MNTRRRAPAASASSTAYWISGLSTTGSISFGLALVAGRKRVPRPATGNTAVRMVELNIHINLSAALQRRLRPGCSTARTFRSPLHDARTAWSVRSAHLNTAGHMLSQERHFGQRQYQPTLFKPQSSHW